MHREKILYQGQEIEIETFDTTINPNAPVAEQLQQAAALMQEDEDTKAGKRPIKPVDKRRKPGVIK